MSKITDALQTVYASAAIMQSKSADLAADTWTFDAAYFRCQGGEHVIIHRRDWNAFEKALRDADNGADQHG